MFCISDTPATSAPATKGDCHNVNFDLYGTNLKNMPAVSWEDCAGKCQQASICFQWVFVTTSKLCFFKNTAAYQIKQQYSISGPKSCGKGGKGNYISLYTL